MKRILTFAGILCTLQFSMAQQKQEALDYIARYKDLAIHEMLRCQIPASITLSQGIHESGCGKSPLCIKANNHFGIKCTNEWDGKKHYQNDDSPNECFRVYDHPEDSYTDHSDFLKSRPRYSFLFQLPITDYKAWAYGLKNAGYATNPKYTQILLNTIELYNLQQYDAIGLAMMRDKTNQVFPPSPQQTAVAKAEPVKTSKHPHKIKEKDTPEGEVITDKTQVRQEYSVNGSWAVKAQGNEDPLAIAFAYNIDYARLVAFNDLAESEHFKDGEYIYLQTKKGRGTQPTCIATQGESMRDISQKFGIKLKELYPKNLMAPNDQVYPGETVYLQEKRTSHPRTMTYVEFLKSISSPRTNTSSISKATDDASASADAGVLLLPQSKNTEQPSRYKVDTGNTLYSIARKFNLSIEELKALNNLHGTDLHPGQTLVVSK